MAIILVLSIKKRRSTLLNVLLACIVWCIAFGLKNTLFLLVIVGIDILLLWAFKPNEYFFTIFNITILYIYKIFGKSFEPRIRSTFDVSGILMILVVKMGYATKDYDGNVKNLLEYIFFIPGLVSGPAISYSEFITRDRMVEVPFPYYQLFRALAFMIAHAIFRLYPFKDYILSPSASFISKLGSLYLFNLHGRTRFHFAWNFSHCCFILYNLPEYLNIDFYKVEFTSSLGEISAFWNRFISLWLKRLFFEPLKKTSLPKAIIVTHLISAALHGLSPCYLIFFISFSMYRAPVTFANEFLHFKILKQIQMSFFVSYFSVPFYLLDLRELFQVWKSLYFYGHVYFTFLFLCYWSVWLLGKSKKVKKE